MKKTFLITASAIVMMLILQACAKQYSAAARYDSGRLSGNSLAQEINDGKAINERKILYSAYITMSVKNQDTANYYLADIASKYNGYVHESGTYRCIIRVKTEYLDTALYEIGNLGKINNKNITGQDVTEEFADYEIRLENARKSRERYLELLAKAENVEAALKVEKELERLNETIELYEGKLNRLNHLSEFSTITVELKEKKKPGIIGYVGIGLYYSVKWLFVRN